MASSSTDEQRKVRTVNLTVPTSWGELNQKQLRTVFDLLALEEDHTAVKTLALIAFTGIKVQRRTRWGWSCLVNVDGKDEIIDLKTWMVQSFIHQLDYIDQVETMDCRLDAVCGLHAVDGLLYRGVTFEEYLFVEKYFQQFLNTRNMDWLDNVAMWLYQDKSGRAAGYGDAVGDNGKVVREMTLTPGERVGTLLWYSHVKRVMAERFPHFFRTVATDEDGEPEKVNFLDQYNVQLRALTDGDPTKEKAVLALNCWRALTELDAKAREAEELEKIRKEK